MTLSAVSDTGSLGSAGGEIATDEIPASYTVYATATGCEVTEIVYVQNGTRYVSYGDSVTITAYSDTDFTTTTFTAYTDSGVTATFTVNHKYYEKDDAYYMWETSHEATIRSITGNGLNKTLSYTMTIPNSYDGQTNLTAEQVATIQGLIGRSDGKTYMVNYTRTIWVYTPAEYSATGQKYIHGVFDGNNSSEIETCVSTWAWGPGTKEAIRQAASSSLSFTTGLPVDCTAIWIDTSTGKQLYSTSFGSGIVTQSSSTVVSVSYTDYPGAGEYIYESLSYSGDGEGTSTSQSFSQTYTSSSSSVTVTFYCHPEVTNGSITVRVIDGDTDELVTYAKITCGSTTIKSNPYTFSDLEFGTYTVSATANGYSSASSRVTISEDNSSQEITLRIYLEVGNIIVAVKDSYDRQPIEGATISCNGVYDTTDYYGEGYLSDIEFGTYL